MKKISSSIAKISYISSILFTSLLLIGLTNCHNKPAKTSARVTNFNDLNISQEIKLNVRTSKMTAFVFLSAECPICTRCALDLQEFYKSVKKQDVTFYAVFPNSERNSAMRTFREYYGLTFMMYPDADKKLADFFNVKVTPEVALVDENANLLYKGALDNTTKAATKRGEVSVEKYLVNAITAHLNGEEIEVKNTDAVGCYLEKRKR